MEIIGVIVVVAIVVICLINGKKKQAEAAKQEEAKKKAAAAAAEKAATAEKLKKAEILKPSCEKGDCWWHKGSFYFTCPENFECERKTYTKKDWANDIPDARVIPYLKRLEKATGAEEKEVYKDFMDEILPQYGRGQWGMAEAVLNQCDPVPMINIALYLGKQPYMEDMVTKLKMLRTLKRDVIRNAFFMKESLYNRSTEDFKYTMDIAAVVLDEERLETYFKDTSAISIEQLYDNDGNIIEAGIGGPKNGFYGSCIFNIVESWGGENGENNAE